MRRLPDLSCATSFVCRERRDPVGEKIVCIDGSWAASGKGQRLRQASTRCTISSPACHQPLWRIVHVKPHPVPEIGQPGVRSCGTSAFQQSLPEAPTAEIIQTFLTTHGVVSTLGSGALAVGAGVGCGLIERRLGGALHRERDDVDVVMWVRLCTIVRPCASKAQVAVGLAKPRSAVRKGKASGCVCVCASGFDGMPLANHRQMDCRVTCRVGRPRGRGSWP